MILTLFITAVVQAIAYAQNLSDEPGQNCAGAGTECVPYNNCDDQIPFESSGLVDVALTAGPCPGSLDVCCPITRKTIDLVVSPPVLTTQECGYRSANGVGVRISGQQDNESQFGEFPWMTAVMEKVRRVDGEKNVYLCGGSLIHPQVILTAAHCVAKKPNNVLKVRLGEWDTQTISEPLPYQDRDIVEVRIHPDFVDDALANDAALLFLDSAVTIAENVKTICLPPTIENFDRRRCYATGWGKDKFGAEGRYQVILKKIDLPVVPQVECQAALRSTRLSKFFELHDSFICAGGESSKDTCRGDGGSPLVCPLLDSPNRYYQAGIVAWGIGCGSTNIPGVYAKVTHFKDWIDNSLVQKGLDRRSYTA